MAAQLAQHTGPDLMTKVAIVEDNATLRKYLTELIGSTAGLKSAAATPHRSRSADRQV